MRSKTYLMSLRKVAVKVVIAMEVKEENKRKDQKTEDGFRSKKVLSC